MSAYTVGSNSGANAWTGKFAMHPDLPAGSASGIDLPAPFGVADMTTIVSTLKSNGVTSAELLKDSDVVLTRVSCAGSSTGSYCILSWWKDFPLRKLLINYSWTTDVDSSGNPVLRAISRSSFKAESLENALSSVGYNVGTGGSLITDSYVDAAAISTLNQALHARRVWLQVHKL